LANVGWTANARVIEAACVKMLSHQLEEVREIGADVKRVAVEQTPTLVKYAEASQYLHETPGTMRKAVAEYVEGREQYGVEPDVEMVNYDLDGEDRFFAAWLYRFGGGKSFLECKNIVSGMDRGQKEVLARMALGALGEYDKAGRELELPRVEFDAVLDYGSYYDFKRNRPMTQIVQEVDGALGVILPAVLYEVGVGDRMEVAMKTACEVAGQMKPEFEGEDGYLYANGTLMRMLLSMNLRELIEFWKTRASPRANPGYKYLAAKMGELAEKKYPNLWGYLTAGKNYLSSGEIYDGFYRRVK